MDYNKAKIIELLKEEGKYTKEDENGYFIIYANKNDFESGRAERNCNENGYIITDHGESTTIFNLGSLDKNVLGLYCLSTSKQKESETLGMDERRNIASNEDDTYINKVFEQHFTQEYLDNNLNMNTNIVKNNALNITKEYNGYGLTFTSNDKKMTIDRAPFDNKYRLYGQVFRYLISKKSFDENVLSKIDSTQLTDEDKLKLLAVYARKREVAVKTLIPEKTNEEVELDEMLEESEEKTPDTGFEKK